MQKIQCEISELIFEEKTKDFIHFHIKMVFTTIVSLVRSRGPDEFWRKRKIFKLAAVGGVINFFSCLFTKFLVFSISMEEDETATNWQSLVYCELLDTLQKDERHEGSIWLRSDVDLSLGFAC